MQAYFIVVLVCRLILLLFLYTGGCDKQITELREAIVKPITHKHLFTALGIKAPKGLLVFLVLSIDFAAVSSIKIYKLNCGVCFCRSAVVWAPGYRKNAYGARMCRSDQRLLP
jgi:hypothetical protein